ncbi:hypothetical protein SLEP1_g58524 [Rubroshorea leprosula]|uniref:CG-1 domain-containing protein n=1 Tax=Rubroshorea leprosula TaxID=152421 RepID=A0AAV5MPJ9_9ROSI|nr:hypothetical protein SLEP1_g58524 [Rubroshorea leprosula]
MAEPRRSVLGNQLDIQQILLEAQNRWLRPAEICEILENYKEFRIAPEPPNRPLSGSLFLFNRKVLRYFRKDGHNWRKKKDGKTVKEAHERLKAGSIDVLHCYYAHGEENENFQRRSYWMLKEELSHIVLVHYRDVTGNRANFNHVKETEAAAPCSQEMGENMPNSEMESSVSSKYLLNNFQVPSPTMDTTSLNSAQAAEYEDAESVYIHQETRGFHSFLELQAHTMEKIDAESSDLYVPLLYTNNFQENLLAVPVMDLISTQPDKVKYNDAELSYESEKHPNFVSWEDVLEDCTPSMESVQYEASFPSTQSDPMGELLSNNFLKKQEFGGQQHVHKQCQSGEQDHVLPADSDGNLSVEGKSIYSSTIRQHSLDDSLIEENLKKLDSFSRWMSKELEDVADVDESHTQSSSGAYWETVENENGIDTSSTPSEGQVDNVMLGPSMSQDQLFSIIDFSPNWAYVGSESKVLVTGRVLKSPHVIENCKWSCMFGEVEVPAEVIADGVLRCHTPIQEANRVPFYITCSNRLACSEVREFEYRTLNIEDINTAENYSSSDNENLHLRFDKLLCLNSKFTSYDSSTSGDISQLISKINTLLKDDISEWEQMLKLSSEKELSSEDLKEQLLQKPLKEKLRVWLLQKVAEGDKGPSVLDEGGQGVLHFAAALGYDWAFEPTIVAGVSVNFRDVNGWTALHWAASCGREHTVASLISLGAAPGALIDPSPKYPLGRTPADLASDNGHKGIAGYLAEYSLSVHLSSLNLDNQDGNTAEGPRAVQENSERSATPRSLSSASDGQSLKDSLAAVCNAAHAAVCNAAHAAARIHEVFRLQSFQKRQLKEYGDDKFGMSDDRALSLLVVKSYNPGQKDEPVHVAAMRIQNKFRSWKGRKDFLIIREQIVKIQAYVRGHQVRKNYRKIIWCVGIVEKVILRWRRKGSGLRGFKPEALTKAPNMVDNSSKEDDYDFLKEGRKQTEERTQRALARVKSMVQYPEGRDQYHRLLNLVTEKKVVYDKVLNSSDETTDLDEDLIDLLDDDTLMPAAS